MKNPMEHFGGNTPQEENKIRRALENLATPQDRQAIRDFLNIKTEALESTIRSAQHELSGRELEIIYQYQKALSETEQAHKDMVSFQKEASPNDLQNTLSESGAMPSIETTIKNDQKRRAYQESQKVLHNIIQEISKPENQNVQDVILLKQNLEADHRRLFEPTEQEASLN